MMRLAAILPACVLLAAAIALAEVPEPNFDAQTIDAGVEIGYGVAVGDVNGNGRTDILLADKSEIVWYANPGEPGADWPRHVMAADLTERDNVCIAARDITGDGRVEVAIGAQWNPGETTDPEQSGAVFYLHRPDDPTERWEPRQIEPHDPTTHRMRWVKVAEDEFRLAVLPLHGIGNRGGEGDPVRLQFVTVPDDPKNGEWDSEFSDTGLNMTHNFDVGAFPDEVAEFWRHQEYRYVIGRQGISPAVGVRGGGEIRVAIDEQQGAFLFATIEPMHGSNVVAYYAEWPSVDEPEPTRHVLDDTLNEGHALAAADFLGIGRPQVAAGWRRPNDQGRVGVRMYIPLDDSGENWRTHTIDDDQMAAEDMAVADLNGNGRPDLIVAGRATNNLVIYWNRE